MATALDPRFKDLKCLPKAEREPVWVKLSVLVREGEPALQPREEEEDEGEEEDPGPPKKKLLIAVSDSESDEEPPVDNVVQRYRVGNCAENIKIHSLILKTCICVWTL